MYEIPKILSEKEFAKRLQLAKETYIGGDIDGTENVADSIC